MSPKQKLYGFYVVPDYHSTDYHAFYSWYLCDHWFDILWLNIYISQNKNNQKTKHMIE